VKVAVLGGTRFIGRAIVERLASDGHNLLVAHRGVVEPDDFPTVQHLHVERKDLVGARDQIARFDPEAVVDTIAMTRPSARIALEAVPGDLRRVVLSSVDVYRAYGALLRNEETDLVPFSEEDPVRLERYPLKGMMPGGDDYEKLDVEEEYLGAGAIVCRLPMVYGERDGQRRENFILRRVRAGRKQIPIGAGNWLSSRGYVRDIARGVVAALGSGVRREVFNLCERSTPSMALWSRMIVEAAGSDAQLVRVPDEMLPDDLGETGTIRQHLLADASKARAVLGYTDTDPMEALRASVAWHLANPPADDAFDPEPDERALAAV